MASYQSKSVVYSAAFAAEWLAAISTRPAAALVAAPKVRLSSLNGFNPVPLSPLSYFTGNEVAYSGYAAGGIAPTFSGPANVTPFILGLISPVVFLAATASPFVPGTAYGWWLDDGTNFVMAELFQNGQTFSFASADDYLLLTIAIAVDLIQQAG